MKNNSEHTLPDNEFMKALKKFDDFWATPTETFIKDFLDENSENSDKAYVKLVRQLKGISEKKLEPLIQRYATQCEAKKDSASSRELALLAMLYKEKHFIARLRPSHHYTKEDQNLYKKAIKFANKSIHRAKETRKRPLGAIDVLLELSLFFIWDDDRKNYLINMSAEHNSAFAKLRLAENSSDKFDMYCEQAAQLGAHYNPLNYPPSDRPELTINDYHNYFLEEALKKAKNNINDLQMTKEIKALADGDVYPLFLLAKHTDEKKDYEQSEKFYRRIMSHMYQILGSAKLIMVIDAINAILRHYSNDESSNKLESFKKGLQLRRFMSQFNENTNSRLIEIYKDFDEPYQSYVIYHVAMAMSPRHQAIEDDFKQLATNKPAVFAELMQEDSPDELNAKLPVLLGNELAEKVRLNVKTVSTLAAMSVITRNSAANKGDQSQQPDTTPSASAHRKND